ncbi:hypothetical protein HRbin11_01780 [bacterium HR11]|nr:hypothetical protein HRbin11_01780 [bacterium HR11]
MEIRAIVLDVLRRHLGEALPEARLAAMAEEVQQALAAAWEEVPLVDEEMGYTASLELLDVCLIDRLLNEGYDIRVYRSREPVRPRGVLERKYLECLRKP